MPGDDEFVERDLIAEPNRRETGTLAALTATGIAFGFLQMMVNPALPTIQRDLHTSTTWIAWLVTGFLLVAAVSTPILGKLGDQHGKRRLLVITQCIFLVSVVGSALAPNIATLIAFRALQGVGGSVFALAIGIIREEVAPAKVGFGIGTFGAATAAASATGLCVGGLIVDALSWRAMFGFGAAVIAVGIALAAAFVPESRVRASSRLDLPGATLLAGCLVAMLLAATEGNRWGWSSPRIIGLFALSALCLIAWVAVELRVPEPMVNVRLLGQRALLLTNVCTFGAGWATIGTAWIFVALLVQEPTELNGFGLSASEAGLYLLPGSLIALVLSPTCGWLARRYHAKWLLSLGLLSAGAGLASLAFWHERPWQVVAAMCGVGVAASFNFASVGLLVLDAVEPTEAGVANGINSVFRSVGGLLGSQIGAAILAASVLGPRSIGSDSAYVTVFLIGAVVAVVAAVASALVTPLTRARPIWARSSAQRRRRTASSARRSPSGRS